MYGSQQSASAAYPSSADTTATAPLLTSSIDRSDLAADALRPHLTPTRSLSMRNWAVDKAWDAAYMYGAFWLWVFRLPFLIALRFAPNAVEDAVWNVNTSVWRFTLPVINFILNNTFWAFSQLDMLVSRFTQTVDHTTTHARTAVTENVQMLKEKAVQVKDQGLSAITGSGNKTSSTTGAYTKAPTTTTTTHSTAYPTTTTVY